MSLSEEAGSRALRAGGEPGGAKGEHVLIHLEQPVMVRVAAALFGVVHAHLHVAAGSDPAVLREVWLLDTSRCV